VQLCSTVNDTLHCVAVAAQIPVCLTHCLLLILLLPAVLLCPASAVRITREAGVEYDDICASGLTSQPFPVPLDLFDLPHLSSILNLDTWQNVLEERDRQQLRALLPPGGLGEGPGGELEQLLQGEANLHFGNPVQRMWRGLQAGEWGCTDY
jgi:hypothetical protein